MTGPDSGPLAGRTVVVTRATDQAGSLACALRDRGATVVELPVIAIVDSADEGAALIAAVERAVDGGYDWIVVTSPNGAHRVVTHFGVGRSPVGLPSSVRRPRSPS